MPLAQIRIVRRLASRLVPKFITLINGVAAMGCSSKKAIHLAGVIIRPKNGKQPWRVAPLFETNSVALLRSWPEHACGFRIAALIQCVFLIGCSNFAMRPELRPNEWAPQTIDHDWTPPLSMAGDYRVGPARFIAAEAFPLRPGQKYDLAGLIDIALRSNPQTRRAWESARAAAAEFGAAQAPYYPQADVGSVNGYERTIVELPGTAGKLEQWEAQPAVEITYTLLDFGRRSSVARATFNRLIAANFAFDRAIQNVVFATQSAFYSLNAANAAVVAAQQNLELAQTDFDAVKQRVELGLATEPELLLAKERVAQSRFDLASARLLVRDAQAQLTIALGVPANSVPAIQDLENETLPKTLNAAVETLIAEARRQRPDLSARVADLRASEADVKDH
jgi:outer membrane protein TolC